ncbi:hypothetical protein BDZ45DRAFT_63768 [Acephala macrosclerotiorum]|nr:hypothetical protein BDZ45DRAFT_63768 [Acephala macrosclerotiorum]
MYLTCALCALALLNGAAAYQSSGSQAFGLVRKASNETVTTRTSASSTSVSPCTTTITSILGEKFVGVEESCWTVTVVSRPEMQSKSTSPVDSSSKLTSSSPPTTSTSTTTRPTTSATSNPPNTSLNCASADPVWSSSSTSTPHAVQTSSEKALTSSIAQNNGQTSLESTVSLGGSGGTGGNFVQSTTVHDSKITNT